MKHIFIFKAVTSEDISKVLAMPNCIGWISGENRTEVGLIEDLRDFIELDGEQDLLSDTKKR